MRVPIAVSALDATLEHQDGELARGEETIAFAQRHGAVGLGQMWDCGQDLGFVPHRVHARTELVAAP